MGKRRFTTILPLLALTGCAGQVTYGDYEFGTLLSGWNRQNYSGYYKQGDIPSYAYGNGSIDSFLPSDVLAGNGTRFVPSVGKRKMLVIPVDFSDYPSSNLDANALTYIDSAFFGNDSSNQYFSVSSFFDKSSVSRFHLSGYVAKRWYRSPYSYASLKDQTSSSKNRNTIIEMYNNGISWFKSTFPSFDLSSYYINGFIPTYFVYSAPYSGEVTGESNRDSLFWAFTINNPSPISWSGYGMMHVNEGKTDAHTYIHEVGHMLGLDDYYSSNSYTGPIAPVSPLGRMDMMDCSLGDHNCYSKYSLGWGRPYVPTSSCEVTLHPSSGSNEFILFSSSWNGTPYDEYIMLEYYTPNYLNFVDYAYRDDPSMRLFGKSGIKVYHVDSRLGVYESPARYKETLSHGSIVNSGDYLKVVNSNSLSDSKTATIPTKSCLIQLLDKSSGNDSLSSYFIASDHVEDIAYDGGVTAHLRDSLFVEGDTFGYETFNNISFHNGASFSFKFTVKELTSAYAKISINF